jgi:nucleoside-diphosphate-sugar epimerase
MSTQTVLFGGGGYIGRHLEDKLVEHAVNVVVVDKPGTACDVEHEGNLVSTMDQIYRWLGSGYKDTDFIHLACPRNKNGANGTWDTAAAVEALEDGLEIARCLPRGRRMFISSMSVYDEPPNPYGAFKHTAEVAAKMAGFGIIRLATVLGGKVCYREDLGLHRIAAQLAEGHSAWVNSEVLRHVADIEFTVDEILAYRPFTEIAGTAYFKDIVSGLGASIVAAEDGNTFVAKGGPPLLPHAVAHLKCVFADLIQAIRKEDICPI